MDRYESTRNASIMGIIGNIILLFFKGVMGFISGSQAMIADALNSASDIFSSIMSFIGNKIASEPEDETHNFGHGKAEYIFSLFISIAMIIGSLYLLLNSVVNLMSNPRFEFSYLLIIICIITIIVKLVLFIYTNKLYKKHGNILIKASMVDHRNDCIITTFTLISILLSQVHIYWFDSIVGIGISVWICIVGTKIFMESCKTLMDSSLDMDTKNTIIKLIESHEEVKKVGDFYSTPSGYKYVVVIIIYVDGNMSTFTSHELADTLEKRIKKISKVHNAIIHINPL